MKWILFLFTILSSSGSVSSQGLPIIWNFQCEQVSADEVNLVIKVMILPRWHLYSQYLGDKGPMPTRFIFKQDNNYQLIGSTEESGDPVTFYDSIYEMNITWYSDKALFRQRVHMKAPKTSIQGIVEYMVCNQHSCIPDRKEFNINVDLQKKSP
jgi:thiol:disulfide interchange protein DsbD